MIIIYKLYEKFTIQLASVGLVHTRLNYKFSSCAHSPTILYFLILYFLNTFFIRNKSGNYVHTHFINNDHMRGVRTYVKRNDQNNYKFSASCGQSYSPLIPSLSYGCKHIFHQK